MVNTTVNQLTSEAGSNASTNTLLALQQSVYKTLKGNGYSQYAD